MNPAISSVKSASLKAQGLFSLLMSLSTERVLLLSSAEDDHKVGMENLHAERCTGHSERL